MNQLPHLSFLSPEIIENIMVVDEIDLGHEIQQPLTPFKGSKFIVYPGHTSPLDVHDVKECWFVAIGSGVVTYSNSKKITIEPGDVLYFESQQSHEVHNNGTGNLLIFSVWWS